MRFSCHFRILLLLLFLFLCVFVSIFCMKLSFSLNLSLSLSTSPRVNRPIKFVLGVAREWPCSTRGRCAPRAPPRVHRPVTFVLGVVREYTCSTRGRCAPRGLCPSCTSGTRVVQKALEVLDPVTAQKLAEKFKGRVREATRSPRGARRRGRPGDHDQRRPGQVPFWRGKSIWERPPYGLTPAKLLACSSPPAIDHKHQWQQ